MRNPTDKKLTKYAENILFLEESGISLVEAEQGKSDVSNEVLQEYLKGKNTELEKAKK